MDINNSKPYLIDKIPADGNEIIEKAKEYGYKGNGGIFQTSIAARILREHKHMVEYNPQIKIEIY